ncbi:uncharacterized protein LOC144137674 [Haemaphysalis longicornis]
MKTLLTALLHSAFFFFVSARSSAATTTKKPLGPCREIFVPDGLLIRKCMGYYFNLCAVGQHSQKVLAQAAEKFGKCLGDPTYTWIFNSSISMPKRTDICKNKLTTSVLRFGGLEKCTNELDQICRKWSDVDGLRNLGLLVHVALCFIQKEPAYRDLALWKTVACSALSTLQKKTVSPILEDIIFLEKLLRCEPPKPPVTTPSVPAC